jgi:serine/threonine protein kinase
MKIKIGSVYNVTFKSGNTHTAFSWPSKIPDSGNRYMKHKVIKIKKKLNPKDSLDYDYVGDVYDKIDGAVELKNIKIVSKQLILKSSPFKVAGKRKKSKKRTKKRSKKGTKNRTKKRNKKKSSRKMRRSSRKTRKRKMRGGQDQGALSFPKYEVDGGEVGTTDDGRITYSFNLFLRISPTSYYIKLGEIKYTYSGFESLMKILKKKYPELMRGIRFPWKTGGDGKSKRTKGIRRSGLIVFLNNLLSKDNNLRYFILSNFAEPDHPLLESTFELGRGSFGVVYQVRKIGDNKNYAMKTIDKSSVTSEKDLIIDERNLLETITRNYVPYVVRMYCSFQTQKYCCMVLNLGVMDISAFIEDEYSLDLKSAQFIAAEIVLALEGLHDLNIVHRDLKPGNIMIDNSGHIFLTDFGLSKKVEATDGETKGITDSNSTFLYSAPEMFGETLNYGKAVDWWALGIIIYEMLTPNGLELSHPCYGLFPYDDKGVQYTVNEIEQENFMHRISEITSVDLEGHEFTDDTVQLLSGLLMVNPDKRLTYPSEIKDHPFFNEVKWAELLERDILVANAEISEVALRETNKNKLKKELSGDSPDPLIEKTIHESSNLHTSDKSVPWPIWTAVKSKQQQGMTSSIHQSSIFTHNPEAAAMEGWNDFNYFASPEMGGLFEVSEDAGQVAHGPEAVA